MSSEKPVIISISDGTPISGILHEPTEPCVPRIGIHILNPGIKTRVAPNRLNVLLARHLADRGFFVLRVDPPGIGDSGGMLEEATRAEIWRDVEYGLWAGFVNEVNDRFVDECGLDELLLVGNCGGAITALLAAEENSDIRRMVLVDIPVADRDHDSGAGEQVYGEEHGRRILVSYLKKIRDPAAWVRIFRLKTDFRTIGRALVSRFVSRRKTRAEARKDGRGLEHQLKAVTGINKRFARSFVNIHERGGQILYVHAGEDNATLIFNRMVGEGFMASGAALARHPRITIPGANHIYGTAETRKTLIEAVVAWVTKSD